MNLFCRYPTRGWRKKTGPGDRIFIAKVVTRATSTKTGRATRQQVTSIVRFHHGIGPELLIVGIKSIIVALEFLVAGSESDVRGIVRTREAGAYSVRTTGLPY
jgi:hypothetical protein